MIYESMEARITANSAIDDETGCWNWLGKTIASRNGKGREYPVLGIWNKKKRGSRNVRVHRLVIRLTGREIRRNQVAAHSCNNPRCVNPAHLRATTQSRNMIQCVNEGRHNNGH